MHLKCAVVTLQDQTVVGCSDKLQFGFLFRFPLSLSPTLLYNNILVVYHFPLSLSVTFVMVSLEISSSNNVSSTRRVTTRNFVAHTPAQYPNF